MLPGEGSFMNANNVNGMRRERAVAARLIALFCLGLVISPFIGACNRLSPEMRGKVFLDLNGNNLPDPGEKGMEGVLVTNGEAFKRTDFEGNFRLSSDGAINIWISSPRGYQPVESFFLPVEPSRGEYNFGLSPAKEGKEEMVRVAFGSDLHLSDNPSISSQVEIAIEAIKNSRPHAVFMLGDLHGDANSAEPLQAESIFKEVNKFRERLLVPSYCALGNHDIFGWSAEGDSPSKHPLLGKLMFEKLIGPRFYSLNIAGVHLIVLDVLEGKRREEGWNIFGWLDEKQQKWLREDLSTIPSETPLIILTHFPLLSSHSAIYRDFFHQSPASKYEYQGYKVGGSYVANLDQWFSLLGHFRDITFISGHLHIFEDLALKGREKILRFYCCGALCVWQGDNEILSPYLNISFPPGFLLLTLREGKVIEALHKIIELP
ncbi:hypothetical protein CEE39_04920 [bacterium (candidate division B38) B3_B38]|nr:MAG: hypothetical protein CEE39_04920 [bacterium (candidate division B38) B3_B38]